MRAYKIVATVVAVPMLLFGMGGVAVADDISNSIDTSIDAVAEVMPLNVGGPTGTTTLYVDPTGEKKDPADGKSGCNLTGQTTLVLAVASSNTSVATVSPPSVTFTNCGDTHLLTITPVAAGSATISASLTSNNTGGSFNLAPVEFTVNVVAPAPSNTAPTVAVTGVTLGASYAKGSVPAAGCDVIDLEDGNSTFAATLSDITGSNAEDGIGSQTASCSYTDAGGLTASSSVIYSIIDPSAPVISYILAPATPDLGSNGWYTSNVTLTWAVTELESPGSLVMTGCVDKLVNADQDATPYTCSATSAGGSAGPVNVTIKRDATAPVVTGSVTSTVIDVSGTPWYKDSADVAWQATDATSGVKTGSLTPTSATLLEGWNQSAAATAYDNAGNLGTGSVTGINVDASAPTVTATISSTPDYGSDWYKDSVSIAVSAADPALVGGHAGSGLSTDPTGNVTLTSTGSYSTTATDNVGHSTLSNSVTYNVDSLAPSVGITCPTGDVIKGSTATAGWTASDEANGSGLVGPSIGSVALDTSSVGIKTATAPTASDNVGHTSATATCSYHVVFDFAGFFRPIDMGGVYNVAKAGSAIPVKFTLGGDQGLNIFEAGYPKVTAVACSTGATLDTVEEFAFATASGLKYDSLAGQYNYTWKTASTFAGSCRMLTVKFIDGTSQTALFKFTK